MDDRRGLGGCLRLQVFRDRIRGGRGRRRRIELLLRLALDVIEQPPRHLRGQLVQAGDDDVDQRQRHGRQGDHGVVVLLVHGLPFRWG
jgi:hypothetical protein